MKKRVINRVLNQLATILYILLCIPPMKWLKPYPSAIGSLPKTRVVVAKHFSHPHLLSSPPIAMDAHRTISNIGPVQAANPQSQQQSKHSTPPTQPDVAELRLARKTRFCGTCHNLRWQHLGDPFPIQVEDLKKSHDEKWCYTCGLLRDWVVRLMATNRGKKVENVSGKGTRQVKGVKLIFGDTLKLEFLFVTLAGPNKTIKWDLHTLSGK